jgi:hypothetical protein
VEIGHNISGPQCRTVDGHPVGKDDPTGVTFAVEGDECAVAGVRERLRKR